MTRIEEMMVETYYTLIKNERRDTVPDYVSDTVKQAVADKLEADKVGNDDEAME